MNASNQRHTQTDTQWYEGQTETTWMSNDWHFRRSQNCATSFHAQKTDTVAIDCTEHNTAADELPPFF